MIHTKYWGQPIDQDEVKWVGTHRELTDTDESEVARGCFALDFDAASVYFMRSKLWIRKDYLRIYDFCESRCEYVSNKLDRAPSAVITGQPGLGKSYWILYAVRRRLGEAKPFLWMSSKQWYLFVEDGVFQVPPGCLDPTIFVPYIWTFVDADHCSKGVPSELAVKHSKAFTIFVTSPRASRWLNLKKATHLVKLIMNPWTWEEMSEAADIHKFTQDQRTLAQKVFLDYGPTPGLCIDGVKDPLALNDHRVEVISKISHLTMDSLFGIVRAGEILDMDLSHSIILVKRKDVNDLCAFTIDTISPFVKQLLKKELVKAEHKERLRAYLLTSRVKNSRMLAGLIFESLAQLQLQEKALLDLIPMVKVEAPRSRNAKWESQLRNKASAANTLSQVEFEPEDTVEYNASELSKLQPGVFYVPTAPNQVGLDSFILTDQFLYFFQFSIAAKHEIKEGMMLFLSQSALKETLQGLEWRFIFVIPPGSTIFCPESNIGMLKGFWDRVTLFTAEIDFERGQPQDDENLNTILNEPSHPSPSSSHQMRSSTGPLAQKDVSPISEATSSQIRCSIGQSAQKGKARAVSPVTEATPSHQTRFSTRQLAQKRKRKALSPGPANEATSSKSRQPGGRKVLKTGE